MLLNREYREVTFRRTNIKNSSMDFTRVLNALWLNFIFGFNSTFLSGLDMVFTKNGFEKIFKKISINIESLQQDIYWGTSRCYELSFRQLLCVAFAHGTLRDIQCATCEKRTNSSLPASFQKIMLAFIREPVVFSKTIIPVARCTLLSFTWLGTSSTSATGNIVQ